MMRRTEGFHDLWRSGETLYGGRYHRTLNGRSGVKFGWIGDPKSLNSTLALE